MWSLERIARAVHGGPPKGREVGALDAVIAHLIERMPRAHRWLSFGKSTEQNGPVLDAGLAAHKEMFGSRTTVHYTLALEL